MFLIACERTQHLTTQMESFKDPTKYEERICVLCGKPFQVYKLKTQTSCCECLSTKVEKRCEICGCVIKRKRILSLSKYLGLQYCSSECRAVAEAKPRILIDLFNSLILESKHLQKPNLEGKDLEDVILENCAYFRLYELYTMLEPYSTDGVKLENRLPSTQIFLLDVLKRIRNLNQLLRISPERKPIGYYENHKSQSKWETGPSDEDLREIEREKYVY